MASPSYPSLPAPPAIRPWMPVSLLLATFAGNCMVSWRIAIHFSAASYAIPLVVCWICPGGCPLGLSNPGWPKPNSLAPHAHAHIPVFFMPLLWMVMLLITCIRGSQSQFDALPLAPDIRSFIKNCRLHLQNSSGVSPFLHSNLKTLGDCHLLFTLKSLSNGAATSNASSTVLTELS